MANITLTDLNNYTRSLPSKRITVDKIQSVGLFMALLSSFIHMPFDASDKIELLIKTKTPIRGKAHGESKDMPTAGAPAFGKANVPLAELIDIAGITKQAMDRVTGMPGSWGSAVDMAIDDLLQISWQALLQFSTIGTGTGKLCRLVSAAQVGSTAYVRCASDSTYVDYGWDNVTQMYDGMLVEIYDSGLTTKRTASGGQEVSNVTPGRRSASTYAAANGTFDIECADASTAATLAGQLADNDVVYWHGTKSDGLGSGFPLPRGLFYFLQDGTHMSDQVQTGYFNLTRTDYNSLVARIYQATDFGLSSESPADGTPTFWDDSVIGDVCHDIKHGSGHGIVDTILVNDALGKCYGRMTKDKVTITLTSEQAAAGMRPALPRAPKVIEGPDGPINVISDEAIPANCMILFDSHDAYMYQHGEFDWLRLFGDIWGPSKGDRKTDWEAPYGGYLQFAWDRCDNMALVQDLRSDCA